MGTSSLLQDVEGFLNKTGMFPTVLGKEALNDPNFVFDLREGRDYRRSTEERLRVFMSKYKPSKNNQ